MKKVKKRLSMLGLFFVLLVVIGAIQAPIQLMSNTQVTSKNIFTSSDVCPIASNANTAVLVSKYNIGKSAGAYVASIGYGESIEKQHCIITLSKNKIKKTMYNQPCNPGVAYSGKRCLRFDEFKVDSVSWVNEMETSCTVKRNKNKKGVGGTISISYQPTFYIPNGYLEMPSNLTILPSQVTWGNGAKIKNRYVGTYEQYLTTMKVLKDDIEYVKNNKALILISTGGKIRDRDSQKFFNNGCHLFAPNFSGKLYQFAATTNWDTLLPPTDFSYTLNTRNGENTVTITKQMLSKHLESVSGGGTLNGIQVIYADSFATFCPADSTYAGTMVGSTVGGKKITTTKDCNVYCSPNSDKGKDHLLTLSELKDITKACKLYTCPTYTDIKGTSKTKYLLKEEYADGNVHKVENEEDCYWHCETKQNVLKRGISDTSKIPIAGVDVSSAKARNKVRDNHCFVRCPVQKDSKLLVIQDKEGKLLKQKNGDKSEDDCYGRCETKNNTLKKGISDTTKIPTEIGLTLDKKEWNKIRHDYCFVRCPDDASKNPHKLLPKGEKAEDYCNIQTNKCLPGTRKAGKKIPKDEDATWCDIHCPDGSVVPLDIKDSNNSKIEGTKAFYCKVRFCPKPNNKQKLGSGFRTKADINKEVKRYCKVECPPETRKAGKKIPKNKDAKWCNLYCSNDKSRIVPKEIKEDDKKAIKKFCEKPSKSKCPPNSNKPGQTIPEGQTASSFCWASRITDCHNVPPGATPPPHCRLGSCGYNMSSSSWWSMGGSGTSEDPPVLYEYPLYEFAKTVDVKTETVTGTYMVYAEIRPVFPKNFSSLPQEEQDYWRRTHLTVQTVPVLTEYGQYILENRNTINSLSGLHKAGGVGNSSDYTRTWREIYQNALLLSQKPIPEIEVQFENEDTTLGNERGGLYTYTEYRSTITISSGTKQDYYYRNGCEIDTGSSGGGGMGGGSSRTWTRHSHSKITKEKCCDMQGEKTSGLKTTNINESFSGVGGYSYYSRRVTRYIGELEEPIIIDGEYTTNAQVTLDPTFKPYTSYQTLTVRCNKDRFLSEIGKVGGTVLHSSNATSTGRSPNVNGRVATFFDGLGVDFFYEGKACENLYGCVGGKNHLAEHDGKNNISKTIENVLGKFGAQAMNEEGEQKVSSVFSFFRDNISHPVRNDVWWLNKNGADPEITIDNSEEAEATFYTLDRNGTPTDQLFYFEDKDKNVITNGADLKNLKNAWYVNGQENLFHWRGKWATENGKPHQMNIKYAYKPIITTTNIQTFGRNGVTTENTESPIDMVCEVRFNTDKSYKPIIFNKPKPWVYEPFRTFDNTDTKKMQVNFVKSSKE